MEFYNDYLHDQMEDDLNEHARDLTWS
jgi:hypothetical protein